MNVAGPAAIGTVSGGTANLNGPSAAISSLGNATVNLGNGTALTVASGLIWLGTIAGPGSLNVTGPGTLRLP